MKQTMTFVPKLIITALVMISAGRLDAATDDGSDL